MPKLIDISLPIHENRAAWPGDPPFEHTIQSSMDQGARCNVSHLSMGAHFGTHVDAPYHFVNEGKRLHEIELSVFCGPAYVLDVSHVPSGHVQPEHLAALPEGVERLLIKTRNSQWIERGDFITDYCAVSPEAAKEIIRRGVRLLGIDAYSIAPFTDTKTTHDIILGAGCCALESIALGAVEQGFYKLWCLPLKVHGADGAPARAVLYKG